jgi:hypothetical protein
MIVRFGLRALANTPTAANMFTTQPRKFTCSTFVRYVMLNAGVAVGNCLAAIVQEQ